MKDTELMKAILIEEPLDTNWQIELKGFKKTYVRFGQGELIDIDDCSPKLKEFIKNCEVVK